jgi:cytochrome c-type biogenesis protein CcmH/NrfG
MSPVVLLILAALWAAFLLPQLLRLRPRGRRVDSISAFREQLSVLARSPSAGSGGAYSTTSASRVGGRRTLAAARRRRRIILAGLSVASVVPLLGVLAGVGLLAPLHLAVDVVALAYLGFLVRAYRLGANREAQVHYLPGVTSEPELLLRRPAN